jgi:hypothetical protein
MTTLPKVIHELCADEPAAANHYDLHRFVHNYYFLGCLVVFSQDFPFACPNLAQRRWHRYRPAWTPPSTRMFSPVTNMAFWR